MRQSFHPSRPTRAEGWILGIRAMTAIRSRIGPKPGAMSPNPSNMRRNVSFLKIIPRDAHDAPIIPKSGEQLGAVLKK
jgi:hypothetical protein